jgi:phospholipase/carboxylesterase
MFRSGQNFEYLYFFKPASSAAKGSKKNNSKNLSPAEKHLFFFHGYGADALNVASLHEVLEAPFDLHFYFVEGPEKITLAPGFYGRAWWPLSLKEFDDPVTGKIIQDFSHVKPKELAGLRPNLSHFIENELQLNWNAVILAGFSQGAMLATDLYLYASEPPKGLMIFSGALINKEEWAKMSANRAGQTVFLCHGNQDPVLAITTGRALEQLLREAGLEVKTHYFNGAHEISWAPIKAANDYLELVSTKTE